MALRYVNTDSTPGGDGTTNLTSGSTRAYASLNEWEAARQASLTEPEEVQCSGTSAADSTALVVDGWTTSESNYILMTSHADSRHAGVWSNSVYRHAGVSGSLAAVDFRENFTRIVALQFSRDDASVSYALAGDLLLAGIGGVRIERNIVRSTISADDSVGVAACAEVTGIAANVTANNLVYGFTGLNSVGIFISGQDATTRHLGYSNTVYGCSRGVRTSGTNALLKNNLSVGNTDAYFGDAPESGSMHNGFDEGTDPASNGVDLTASADADIFVDAASNDFRLVAGSDAAAVGIDLSADTHYAFAVDYQGDARGSLWDLGADQITVFVGYVHAGLLPKPIRPRPFAPGLAR